MNHENKAIMGISLGVLGSIVLLITPFQDIEGFRQAYILFSLFFLVMLSTALIVR